MRQVVLAPCAVSRSALRSPDQNYVAAIVVNEDAANWQTNANAVVGVRALLTQSTPSPIGLESFTIWQGSLASVNLNGASDYGVFILTSRNPYRAVALGLAPQICNQDAEPGAPGVVLRLRREREERPFIHAYSDSTPATLAQPRLPPGADRGRLRDDLSSPYFNLNGGCAVVMSAKLDSRTAVTHGPDEAALARAASAQTSRAARRIGELRRYGTSSTWTIDVHACDASTAPPSTGHLDGAHVAS